MRSGRLVSSLLGLVLVSAGSLALEPRALAEPALVGRIEIPRLGIDAPVREGAHDDTLRVAVGHIGGTARPGQGGNAGLAAHRNTFFRPLRDVKVGDTVVVTTDAGSFTYRVDGLRIVDPTEVSVLDPTPAETLTLVTCYPFDWVGEAPQRLIVRAVRVDARAAEQVALTR
jgi:sortase A